MRVTAGDAVLHFELAFGVKIREGTIRQWASRGHISSKGSGWARYDLREIERYVRERGLLDVPGDDV